MNTHARRHESDAQGSEAVAQRSNPEREKYEGLEPLQLANGLFGPDPDNLAWADASTGWYDSGGHRWIPPEVYPRFEDPDPYSFTGDA